MNWTTKAKEFCCVEGCWELVKRKGWCGKHYQKFYKIAPDYQARDKIFEGEKRKHPFYMLWFERKQNNLLCEDWLDFQNFIIGIGIKPGKNFLLLQIDGTKPFGPDNFRWQEHLKKKSGENNKEWWARKRAARIFANPSMESDRNIKRKYNLTREQYDEKLKNQNYVCAICGNGETAPNRASGLKGLAVDHNHVTGLIRDLLCWRCNATIGKINEDIELLEKMKQYLIKYKEN